MGSAAFGLQRARAGRLGMELDNGHLKAICASGLLRPLLLAQFQDSALLAREPASLAAGEREALQALALTVWTKESPCLEERTVFTGNFSGYTIGVYGRVARPRRPVSRARSFDRSCRTEPGEPAQQATKPFLEADDPQPMTGAGRATVIRMRFNLPNLR